MFSFHRNHEIANWLTSGTDVTSDEVSRQSVCASRCQLWVGFLRKSRCFGPKLSFMPAT